MFARILPFSLLASAGCGAIMASKSRYQFMKDSRVLNHKVQHSTVPHRQSMGVERIKIEHEPEC